MEVKWYGHSCFLLTGSSGVRVLMDPPDASTGYRIEPMPADIVTSSHSHSDHNNFALAQGAPVRVTEAGVHEFDGATVTGIPWWHDEEQGKKRGPNMLYVVELDGLRVLHAGDIGALPDEETLQKLGMIDVLLVPVGGFYTIDYKLALELCNMLKPKVVIPMHYKTSDASKSLAEKLAGVLPFLNAARDCSIHRLRQPEATLTRESLGADRIITLTVAKQ
ncbi:MAG: MBL fold metallo-hydrolase [Clostridiaceae bacterium]|nr:MBL fold metallo-hydrolase [Eubacteriales bacterium]